MVNLFANRCIFTHQNSQYLGLFFWSPVFAVFVLCFWSLPPLAQLLQLVSNCVCLLCCAGQLVYSGFRIITVKLRAGQLNSELKLLKLCCESRFNTMNHCFVMRYVVMMISIPAASMIFYDLLSHFCWQTSSKMRELTKWLTFNLHLIELSNSNRYLADSESQQNVY